MGVNLCLIFQDKTVGDLGRAYHYDPVDSEPIVKRIVSDIVAHIGYTPQNREELLEITQGTEEALDYLMETYTQHGKNELLDELREQGFETMTDLE